MLATNQKVEPHYRITHLFLKTAGVILAIAAMAKLVSAIGSASILKEHDPILSSSFRNIFILVGSLELAIAAMCLFSRRHGLSILLIAWISTCIIIYRIGLLGMDWHRPCACLGNLTDAIHISPQVADNVMKSALAYLAIGSYVMLFRQWLKPKNRFLEVTFRDGPSRVEPRN